MKIQHILQEHFVDITDDKMRKLLSTGFSQAWSHFLDTGNAIYRHDADPSPNIILATPLKDREAAYALSNLHNSYINNDSSWVAFPERSVIGTTSEASASRRGESSQTFVILPVNNTPIGVCPKHDIWASFSGVHDIMNTDSDTQSLNSFYRTLFVISEALEHILEVEFSAWIKDSGQTFENFREEINSIDNLIDKLIHEPQSEVEEYYSLDPNSIQERVHVVRCILGFDYVHEIVNRDIERLCTGIEKHGLVNLLDNIFSPSHFDVGGIENVVSTKNSDNEVWFNSAYLMIPVGQIDELREEYGK